MTHRVKAPRHWHAKPEPDSVRLQATGAEWARAGSNFERQSFTEVASECFKLRRAVHGVLRLCKALNSSLQVLQAIAGLSTTTSSSTRLLASHVLHARRIPSHPSLRVTRLGLTVSVTVTKSRK